MVVGLAQRQDLVNHPGPLYFDVLAVPARLFEPGAGVVLGVALVNALCRRYRSLRPPAAAALGTIAMATTAALCGAMGSELLFEPWGPHAVLLLFLFFLVLVWSMTCGDLLALPFAAGVGSLVVQTHLSYVIIVPLLGAWGDLRPRRRARRERGQAPDAGVTAAGERGGTPRWEAWCSRCVGSSRSSSSSRRRSRNITRPGQRSQPHGHDRLRFRDAGRRHRGVAAAVVVSGRP